MSTPNAQALINLLPFDGEALYYGRILKENTALDYLEILLNSIPWKHDEIVIFGKHIVTKRETAWYGDQNYAYTYSRSTRHALLWTKDLLELKLLVEAVSGSKFNSCLLNLYHNGEEGMSWHSDDEKMLAANAPIASLSLGAERKFTFRHKQTKQVISQELENGSLLVMKGKTQTCWRHALPKIKRVTHPRVNLTFRVFNV